MTWLPMLTRLRILMVVGWLTAIVWSLGSEGEERVYRVPTAEPPLRLSCLWDEEAATPDCGTPEPEPYPARQRAHHLARLGVERWHAAGFRGKGVKIAILDTGFRGYRDHLGKALPSQVLVRSFRADGNLEARDSQHGILCGEVIHALAPEAELLLVNWDTESPDRFLDAVRWAREQGARVISCSVITPSWSDGEGGGPVHQRLAQLLGNGDRPGDVLFFASAGNTAKRHWSGKFRQEGDGYHHWEPGETCNRLTPWGNDRISVELCWKPGARYRLSVLDTDTRTEVGKITTRSETGHCCAVARLLPRPGRRYEVCVKLLDGTPGSFHLVALGGDLEYATARGSISFPADGPAVFAVGAVDRHGQRAPYSSCGPNSLQPKPDFVAPVPFPSLWRARPFTGTSAAAPQAAALAALWWSRHPDYTARSVASSLRSAARDLGDPGHDWETGHGLVHLPGQGLPVVRPPSLAQRSAAVPVGAAR